jgi:branched-chain amino acid transport system ATP-binding protein
MSEAVLETRGLTMRFGGLTAVDNISINLHKGEILGMIGANGAGKTTLFNMVAGALRPTSGSIMFKNRELARMPAHTICKTGIARTYQIVKPFTNLTVTENVMVGAFLRYPNLDKARKKTEEVLRFTGMYDLRNRRGSDLTLTQMKQMEVAKALATEPEVLLLDEVTAGVNPAEHPAFIKLIGDIRDSGVSVFIIEHVMRVIMNISDRIYVLNQGKLIAEGLPKEISVNPEVIKSYFGEKHNAPN